MNYFFLVGCPRSGTTMLQQALNRHSQVLVPTETSFFFMIGALRVDQVARWAEIMNDLNIDLPFPKNGFRNHRSVRSVYEEMANRYIGGRSDIRLFGEKTPKHQLRIDEIMEVFPDAKIILLYRDGRDVALSLSKVLWHFSRDLGFNFCVWLHYYQKQVQAVKAYPKNVLCVKYEDIVTKPDAEMRKIACFLGIPFERQMVEDCGNREGILEKELTWKSRALERITPSRIESWRDELSEDQVARLESLGSKQLVSLGYELLTNGDRFSSLLLFVRVYWTMFVAMARQPSSRLERRSYSRLARELWRHFMRVLVDRIHGRGRSRHQ